MISPIYNILIVEDEELFASKLEMQIDKLGHTLVGVVDNSNDALALVNSDPIDLILMDIQIEGQYDGVELAEMIQEKKDIAILFITSQTDQLSFNRAARTKPVGYLLKPFTNIQLERSIELALSQLESSDLTDDHNLKRSSKDGLYLKKRNRISKINFEDIFYINSDGRYCRIHTDEEMFLTHETLKSLTEALPDYFAHSHRSFIVNLKKVKTVDLENDYVLLYEKKVPLSRREKSNLLNRLKELS